MFKIFALASTFSIVIPAIMLLRFKKRFDGYVGLCLFVGNSVFFEAIGLITSRLGIHNLPMFHAYTLVEFCIVSYFLFSIINLKEEQAFLFVSLLFIIYLIINPFVWEPLNTYNSISRSLESILLIGYSSLYFYKIYQEEKIEQLEKQPEFWCVAGIVIYLAMGLFTHLLADFILNADTEIETLMTSYSFVHASNIIKNLMIATGIWIANR